MKNRKKLIIGVTIIILVLIIILVCFISLNNTSKKILNNFIDIGFVNNNDSFLYSKQISDLNLEQYNENVTKKINSTYEILYFNSNTYQLTKDKLSYDDGITKNFTPTYDYTNNSLTYDYRVSFDNTSIIIEGTFNIETRKFVCEPIFSYNIDVENTKQDICNKLQLEVENFEYEAKNLINDTNLLNYISRK